MKKESGLSWLFWLQGIVFFLLGARLIDLQLINGAKNRIFAEENRIQRISIPAGRGIIYDRLGLPLVENVPVYRLEEKENLFQPLSREKALEIQSQGGQGAAKVRLDVGRRYLYGKALSHVLGYVGEVSSEDLQTQNLLPGDLIGRGGIEQKFDQVLRGLPGEEIYETDAMGGKVRTIGQIDPQAGKDLQLAVDASLSQAAFSALAENVGAVVATEAKTGAVLALVSSPAYDPTQISLGISLTEYQALLNNPQQPFFNRALGGTYPPGSTFKIVVAAAGLEEEKITGQDLYEDPGVITIGPYSYRNWYYSQYGRTEGEINVVGALQRSTDTYFYHLGELLGARRLVDWAKNFGLGQKTGIVLPGEAVGLVPDPEWKEKTKGERWFLGNTYHLAIGQSDLTATPLQINLMTAVIANNGQLCQPEILKDPQNYNCRDLGLKNETIRLIKEGMVAACAEGGTAYPLFNFEPVVACKTGTAQFGDPDERTHAWLTAFAPADEPEIVVTVLLEAGGEGSDDAAPIAKKVLEAWFQDSNPNPKSS